MNAYKLAKLTVALSRRAHRRKLRPLEKRNQNNDE